MKHISDVLKEERIKRGLSIEDVVSATKIRRNSILSIEAGRFKDLPSEAYALGFVKNYASFLEIPEARATALFRREYDAAIVDNTPKFRKAIASPRSNFFLKSARGALVLVVGIVVLSYLAFQFSFLVFGPKLEIISPTQNVIPESNIIIVSGKTDPDAQVSVNGEVVYVDLSGSFKKTLYIEEDTHVIEVIAKNRSGKETKKTLSVQAE